MANDHVKCRTRILDELREEVGGDVWDAAANEARDQHELQAGVRSKRFVLIAATVESLLYNGYKLDLLRTIANNLIAHCNLVIAAAEKKVA